MVMIPNEELYLQAAQSIEVHTLVEIQLQTFFFFSYKATDPIS